MPYTLAISMDPIDRWQLHRDLLEGARELLQEEPTMHSAAPSFLGAMQELDVNSAEWIKKVITGMREGGPSQ